MPIWKRDIITIGFLLVVMFHVAFSPSWFVWPGLVLLGIIYWRLS